MLMLTDRVDDELLDAAGPQLRIVADYAVGFDNVDVEACRRRGVVVSNTPDVLTETTAELTIAIVLALLRRVAEGDRLIRRGEEWIWAPNLMLGHGLPGRTLGLVGRGRIGQAVERLALAHGMEVIHSGRTSGLPLAELLASADIVSLHLPLTAESRHLIDAAALARMKPGAVLVNVSRGPVVDEEALVAALREGTIAGAALDVFEHEPQVHPGLLELENVVLVPHLGSATEETREAMGMLCVDALRAVLLEGTVPPNAVA
jgi:glyoxylate reductase